VNIDEEIMKKENSQHVLKTFNREETFNIVEFARFDETAVNVDGNSATFCRCTKHIDCCSTRWNRNNFSVHCSSSKSTI